jgi:uncharacterized protein YbbK (DUF523 family)/uncharacterized protein YbgA (DUF1722 family)
MQNLFKTIRKDQNTDSEKPTLWVSGCILGHEVRFDGGHKKQNFVTQKLSEVVNLVPLCPEVEGGMGTPRESIRLVTIGGVPRALGNRSSEDYTDQLAQWGDDFLKDSQRHQVNGVIFKKGSPSCGLERVRVYPHGEKDAIPERDGRGLFAQQAVDKYEDLPFSEDGWLNDTSMKERFLIQIFTDFRFQKTCDQKSVVELLEFHAQHKFLFMAYDPAGQKRLGRLLSQAGTASWETLIQDYRLEMSKVLRHFPSRKRYTNALQHLAGFLKNVIPELYRREVANAILKYSENAIGLDVPMSLLKHHALNPKAPAYLRKQVYLTPYPIMKLAEEHGIR